MNTEKKTKVPIFISGELRAKITEAYNAYLPNCMVAEPSVSDFYAYLLAMGMRQRMIDPADVPVPRITGRPRKDREQAAPPVREDPYLTKELRDRIDEHKAMVDSLGGLSKSRWYEILLWNGLKHHRENPVVGEIDY